MMNIYEVTDEKFRKYGRIVNGLDVDSMMDVMKTVDLPQDVVYEPSIQALEALDVFGDLANRVYGELPIQVGYCIGNNHKLNAVEYHRNSEINIGITDAILIVGCQQDITDDFQYDTAKMEAFRLPAGCAVELYATTLHYAPCNDGDNGFKVIVVLPKNTNLPIEKVHGEGEDALLTAKNKWLIGHAEGGLPEGTHIGLIGENLTV